MTREEILTVLENAKLHAAFESDVEILDACMSALREQEERNKGCPFCQVYNHGKKLSVKRKSPTGEWEVIGKLRNFCPMCGRRSRKGRKRPEKCRWCRSGRMGREPGMRP